MAQIKVILQDATLVIQSQVFCGTFTNTDENRKALFVFLRRLSCPETGKPLFTHQQLADAVGKQDRRDSENFVRAFRKRGGDFWQYWARKRTRKAALLAEIDRHVLAAPLLSVAEQYRLFCEGHPQARLCEATFRSSVDDIAGTTLLKRVQQWGFQHEQSFAGRRHLEEVRALTRLSQVTQKEILETFPEVAEASSVTSSRLTGLARPSLQKKLLVAFLSACTLPQAILAPLFGVGKTCIHPWIDEICGEELDWQILREIVGWSGRVSFDETWGRIAGQWWFVLWTVDAVSGFPRLLALYPTCDTVSWTLFFRRCKAIYGLPTLIQRDGSRALAAARDTVFAGVRYQACTFHTLKNLLKRLRQHRDDPKRLTRWVRVAKQMFTNASVSSRKAAAKRLQPLVGTELASSLETHILTPWRKLTLSLTTNASERFNRKIEQCFAARYGVPSEESAKVLLRSLWLKELLLNGTQHMQAASELRTLDVSRRRQEHVDTDNILHFFHNHDPSQVEKFA